MASVTVATKLTTSRVDDSNVSRLLNEIDGWRMARKAFSGQPNPMTRATLRKEARGIAEAFESVAAEAEVLLTDSTLSAIDFESIQDLHKRSEKLLRRLHTFSWELRVASEVRRLHASALALHRKNRKSRKAVVN
jgi:hypothetical protein